MFKLLGEVPWYDLYYSLTHPLKWKPFGLETCTDPHYIVLNFYQINKDGEIQTRDRLVIKALIPCIFSISINKDNKITIAIRRKRGAGSHTSLKINSSGAEVLWPVGPKDKHDDFPKGQLWHWKLRCLLLQMILFFEINNWKIREVGWPSRRCHKSAEAEVQGDQ